METDIQLERRRLDSLLAKWAPNRERVLKEAREEMGRLNLQQECMEEASRKEFEELQESVQQAQDGLKGLQLQLDTLKTLERPPENRLPWFSTSIPGRNSLPWKR